MQALVLAGGEGTRLRPLTLTTPKPVMPFAGRPFMTFMLDWLARHGVDDVILSCGFMSDAVESVLGDIHAGIRLRYVHAYRDRHDKLRYYISGDAASRLCRWRASPVLSNFARRTKLH